jgi:hypothetical protein
VDEGDASTKISVPWGSGLATKTDCWWRFSSTWTENNEEVNIKGLSPNDWNEDQCWSYSLAYLAADLSWFLAGQLVADVALINTIDLICPAWWINVVLGSRKAYFQKDLENLYKGVDFKPFLRVQVLLKFVFTAMCLNQLDGTGVASANLWVALCFWQCFEIERFLFVCRYKQPANYSIRLVRTVIEFALPFALFVHSAFSIFLFGWVCHIPLTMTLPNGTTYTLARDDFAHAVVTEDWKFEPTGGKYYGLPVGEISLGIPEWQRNDDVWFPLSGLWLLQLVFIVVWFLPLKIWDFRQHDTFDSGTNLKRIMAGAQPEKKRSLDRKHGGRSSMELDRMMKGNERLRFTEALQAQEDVKNNEENIISEMVGIRLKKYIPDPTRFEFGALKIN